MKDYQLPPTFSLDQFFDPVERKTWRQQVDAGLRGAPYDKMLVTTTSEGLRVEPLYTADSAVSTDEVGFPGYAPFVRGPALAGGWQTRQSCGLPNVEDANAAILDDLERGADGVEVELNADGRGPGTAVRTLRELNKLFDQVDLRYAPVGIRPGKDFFVLAGAFMTMVEERGVHAEQVRADLGCDPYGALARGGKLRSSLETAREQIAELAAVTHAQYPKVRVFTADAGPWHDAGAGDAQSLGLAMAGAVEMLRAFEARGLAVDEQAARIVFRLSLGSEIFGSIALVRAARQLWTAIQEACGIENPRPAVVHVEPARRVLTRRDPWVNLLRNTVMTFAGAVGGANIVTTVPFDSTLGEPDVASRRIARNTQNVLRLESNLFRVADPAGGSWMVESLTSQIAESAWQTLQAVESAGGLGAALLSGRVSELIGQVAEQRAEKVATRRRKITGVSEFAALDEQLPELEPPRPPREMPDPAPVPGVRPDLTVARLMDVIDDGAQLDALANTLELAPAEMEPLPLRALAAPYEALRDRSDDMLATSGQRPSAFLANLGPLSEHTGRAGFAQNLLAAGGIAAVHGDGATTASDVADQFDDTQSPVAVICGTDERYDELAAATAKALKERGAGLVLLAGRPQANETAWSSAGIDGYIHLKCDALTALENIWNALDIAETS